MNYQDIRPIIVPTSALFHVPSFRCDQFHIFHLFDVFSSRVKFLKSHAVENQANSNHKGVFALLVILLALTGLRNRTDTGRVLDWY